MAVVAAATTVAATITTAAAAANGRRAAAVNPGAVPALSICVFAHYVRSDYCGSEFVSAIVSLPVGVWQKVSRATLTSRSAMRKL